MELLGKGVRGYVFKARSTLNVDCWLRLSMFRWGGFIFSEEV